MLRNAWAIFVVQFVASKGFGRDPPEHWEAVDNWPQFDKFGQISAVSIDSFGNVYIFHRGNRKWETDTFSSGNVFLKQNLGPIMNDTIVVLNEPEGTVRKTTGSKRFYMPHGLTVDHENNLWITDVALHQVYKFPPLNLTIVGVTELLEPQLTLGTAFEPGNDDRHFCKPTDVAVDRITREFFVSDGYCNSRIIKYSHEGKKLLHWSRPSDRSVDSYILSVPHSLAIAPEEKMLFVADREHYRTVIFKTDTGAHHKTFQDNKTVYSVVTLGGKRFYTLANMGFPSKGNIRVYYMEHNESKELFSNYYFSNPHDMAISSDGKFCYVVELNPYKAWKFALVTEQKKEIIETLKSTDSAQSYNAYKSGDNNHVFPGGTLIAIGLVSFVIIISFLFFICHLYKKKARHSQYEMRRLILDDEDEIGLTTS